MASSILEKIKAPAAPVTGVIPGIGVVPGSVVTPEKNIIERGASTLWQTFLGVVAEAISTVLLEKLGINIPTGTVTVVVATAASFIKNFIKTRKERKVAPA